MLFRIACAAGALAALAVGAFSLGSMERAAAATTTAQTASPSGSGALRIDGMREGARTEGPPAHTAFCTRSPAHCAPSPMATPGAVMRINDAERARLERFNAEANAAFTSIIDIEFHGVSDYWTLPLRAADCEDYALHKRARLIAAGWPPESVLIAVVESPTDGYHAVLVVRTSQGELVLDNLRDAVLDWRATGYHWVIRQSSQDPSQWVTINTGR